MPKTRLPRLSALLASLFPALSFAADPISQAAVSKAFPPPNPPVVSVMNHLAFAPPVSDGPAEAPGLFWSIGEPTDEEQLYLEFINRSRANPPAEGVRLATTTDPDVQAAYASSGVDLPLMQSQFNSISAAPPLAMNEKLLIAARLHSGDMYTNQFQGHISSSGARLTNRVAAQSYSYSTLGENVFVNAENPWHGHAAFNVDWGDPQAPNVIGGMQTPPGHRISIHNSTFREVGIGLVNGNNGWVGPQVVTQDFGTRLNSTPLITGVAFYDLNGNGFYDLGEGIGGIVVDIPGADYSAVTADSGGYAVPVNPNANYTVNFNASGISTQRSVAISAANVKVDWMPAYTPPVVTGPNPAGIQVSNYYTFNGVGAATAYDWEQSRLTPFLTDGAEEGLARVTASTSAGYSVLVSDVVASGSFAYHLAHPTPPTPQTLQWNAAIQLGASSTLSFSKRLALATTNQVARAQISTNNGATWVSVWSQTGSGGVGENSFSAINIPLTAYANQAIRLRFVYDFVSGSYFPPQPGFDDGLYVDNVSISAARELGSPIVSSTLGNRSFVFTPTVPGDYLLRVRARINSRILPWGLAFEVPAASVQLPPQIQFVTSPVLNGNQVQIEFTVANYPAGMSFQLLHSASVAGVYALDSSASFQALNGNTRFRVTTVTGGATNRFYRVQGAY